MGLARGDAIEAAEGPLRFAIARWVGGGSLRAGRLQRLDPATDDGVVPEIAVGLVAPPCLRARSRDVRFRGIGGS